MSRAYRIFVIVLVLATAVFPLVELFDRWDTSPLPSNDTELCVTCLLAGFGMILLSAKGLPKVLLLFRAIVHSLAPLPRTNLPRRQEISKLVPFLPSTIPLRI
jgi:hypothetical protein